MWQAVVTAESEDAWSFHVAGFFLFFIICYKVLKLFSYPEVPQVFFKDSDGNSIKNLAALCPLLLERYAPPFLWGRNGHLQTIAYGTYGRRRPYSLPNERHAVSLSDGGTSTFDLFEPTDVLPAGDITLAICPGIANSSESCYIRNFVTLMQRHGFRCGVLNHLGALRSVKLTSPRIFTYGGTEEYDKMLCKLRCFYPDSSFILIGFSMGGNIVTKYLGEGGHDISNVICGISVCQGYDVTKAPGLLHRWENLGRLCVYVMAENIKKLLRDHYEMAVLPHVASGLVDESQLWSCTSLLTLDEVYSRKVNGFAKVEEYYRWCSSAYHMHKIRVPMIYLNAADDPVVPEPLYSIAKGVAEEQNDVLFVLTKHGGHLSFFEGGLYQPSSCSWMEKFLLQVANAAIEVYGSSSNLKKPTSFDFE